MTSEEILFESHIVCDNICRRVAAEGKDGLAILLYWPLADEVMTDPAIDRLADEGHTILLPVVVGDDIILREYHGRDTLTVGAFGILEPAGEVWGKERYSDIDLAFIPGRAFTLSGKRLGRGKGYYDRLLPLLKCRKVGICLRHQILQEIPTETHDIVMDEVISD